jgi:hypothetical protein
MNNVQNYNNYILISYAPEPIDLIYTEWKTDLCFF